MFLVNLILSSCFCHTKLSFSDLIFKEQNKELDLQVLGRELFLAV